MGMSAFQAMNYIDSFMQGNDYDDYDMDDKGFAIYMQINGEKIVITTPYSATKISGRLTRYLDRFRAAKTRTRVKCVSGLDVMKWSYCGNYPSYILAFPKGLIIKIKLRLKGYEKHHMLSTVVYRKKISKIRGES